MRRAIQRIRYPPFELGHMEPSAVPVSEIEVEVGDNVVTNFKIGSFPDSWRLSVREPVQIGVDQKTSGLLNGRIVTKSPQKDCKCNAKSVSILHHS